MLPPLYASRCPEGLPMNPARFLASGIEVNVLMLEFATRRADIPRLAQCTFSVTLLTVSHELATRLRACTDEAFVG
jgi:hypothetical protein